LMTKPFFCQPTNWFLRVRVPLLRLRIWVNEIMGNSLTAFLNSKYFISVNHKKLLFTETIIKHKIWFVKGISEVCVYGFGR